MGTRDVRGGRFKDYALQGPLARGFKPFDYFAGHRSWYEEEKQEEWGTRSSQKGLQSDLPVLNIVKVDEIKLINIVLSLWFFFFFFLVHFLFLFDEDFFFSLIII